ncbi:hypothetical protein RhiirA5_401028 [Rhizophagus irregularis]|uniref:Uncharacterized protein n=1 Tax=Rhizophagus irregularis TaxID=588596 RepID=A0A2I1EWG6_9GLOM|nr:hypothetical protein RhiirA5_401028 [Rhizophagus irregularis]PKC72601.1 hypothetical protein RhiirA1_438143 [Rhizophagus irregularis]PKY26454.1 hypothetical protein RhiirB3_473029 [Rhizophagus irregularis]
MNKTTMDYQSRDRYEHDRCNNGRRGFNNFKVIQLIKNINNRKEEEKGDEGKVGGVKKKMNQLDTNDNNNKKLKKKEKKGKDQTDQAFTWSGYQKTKGGEVNDRKKVVEKWEKFENIITEEWINRLEMDISNVE